jgi:hypothetical protein
MMLLASSRATPGGGANLALLQRGGASQRTAHAPSAKEIMKARHAARHGGASAQTACSV